MCRDNPVAEREPLQPPEQPPQDHIRGEELNPAPLEHLDDLRSAVNTGHTTELSHGTGNQTIAVHSTTRFSVMHMQHGEIQNTQAFRV